MPKLKRCEQKRYDCFACTASGCCKALNNTTFFNPDTEKIYKCPFYKKRTEVGYDTDQYNTGGENED